MRNLVVSLSLVFSKNENLSLSFILSKSNKVEQHVTKKIYKSIDLLKILVETNINLTSISCMCLSHILFMWSLMFFFYDLSNKWYQSLILRLLLSKVDKQECLFT